MTPRQASWTHSEQEVIGFKNQVEVFIYLWLKSKHYYTIHAVMHLKNQELITPIVQKPSDPVRAHRRRLQSPGPRAAGGTPGTT